VLIIKNGADYKTLIFKTCHEVTKFRVQKDHITKNKGQEGDLVKGANFKW
jgi:hypothetical protein